MVGSAGVPIALFGSLWRDHPGNGGRIEVCVTASRAGFERLRFASWVTTVSAVLNHHQVPCDCGGCGEECACSLRVALLPPLDAEPASHGTRHRRGTPQRSRGNQLPAHAAWTAQNRLRHAAERFGMARGPPGGTGKESGRTPRRAANARPWVPRHHQGIFMRNFIQGAVALPARPPHVLPPEGTFGTPGPNRPSGPVSLTVP